MNIFNFLKINWQGIFQSETNILELFIRGSIIYLSLIFLLRIVQKRHVGMLGGADFIFVLLLAVSSHYALTGADKSVTAGLTIILTLFFWNFVINWLTYKFKGFKNFISPSPLPLIKDGNILKNNLRKEFITKEELFSELRKQGIKKIENIEEAHIESDGSISVVLKKKKQMIDSGKKIV